MAAMYKRAACAILALLGSVAGLSAVAEAQSNHTQSIAQAAPPPTPTPKPRWVWRATIKAYDFNRMNATNSHQDSADTQINQQSFNTGFAPHVEYNFTQNWTIGATYWLLEPFNGPCYTAASHEAAPCKVVVPAGTLPVGRELNFDDTLPGYQISTLNEAYLQYQDPDTFFRAGNQILNTPWAGPNGGFEGSRIMPDSYQSADFDYKFDSNWQVEFIDSWKFLPRTESDFAQNTLITRVEAPFGSEGYGGLAANIYDPSEQSITTPGFGYARLGYTSSDFTANFHYYDVYDITSIAWVDAKYTMPDVWGHPYIQFQGGTDNSTGAAVAGKIDSELYGLQAGITVIKNVVLQLAYDNVPIKSTTLVLPTGFSCSKTTHTISSPKDNKGNLPYFLPSSGSPDCDTVNGLTTLIYGGWASPYTDGYATDPIFTTSLTQGMADRRSPGQSYMPKLMANLLGHHLVTYVSWAGYDYNESFMAAPTYEFNYDALYYFNKPPAPGQYYRGLSFRYRYGDRTQPFTNSALPEFKYNRFQIEYDF